MNISQIKKLLDSPTYDFLRTNEHLRGRLLFLTLGGSHAYGTNVESSDVDIRGCAMQRASDLIGLSSFDVFVQEKTDTTIYGFNKIIRLFMDCNPNSIEMLGCSPEHYLLMTEPGKLLLDNRNLFLSQKAAHSFGGYAAQQLRRLKNALARGYATQEEREQHIADTLQHSLDCSDFNTQFSKHGSIRLFLDQSERPELTQELFCDIDLEHFPVRDLKQILNTLSEVTKNFDKTALQKGDEQKDHLNHRNRKKDAAHLNKHAMHLIRLYLMCIDILEEEEIITFRGCDRNFLLRIRNGEFQNPDGSYQPEFFEMVDSYEKRLQYAKQNTSLPKKPDYHKIEELVMEINRKALYV